jgi:hypothetical protein
MPEVIPEAVSTPTAPVAGVPPEAAKAPEPPKEEAKLASGQFAVLAKKEKQIFRRAQEIAEKEKQIQEREAKLSELDKRRQGYKLNPLQALEDAGLSYQEITDFILNKEKPTPDAKLEKLRMEVEQLRKQTEDERKRAAEEAQKLAKENEAAAIAEFQSQIKGFVEAHKEEYDVIHLLGAEGMIWQGIVDTHAQTGKIPTIKEAADGVMKFLQSQLDEVVPKTKWWQTKTAPKAEEKPSERTPGSPTLTNDMSSPATTLPATTEAERIKRALAALG